MADKGRTLSEYLVGLGFDVNVDGLNKFIKAIEDGASKIKLSQRITNNAVAESITTFVGLGAAAAKTVLDLTSSVADFDKQMELEARSMWMQKDQYMAMNEAVKALGYSIDDLGTIALDSELSTQFRQLYTMSQQFQGEYSGLSKSLKTMREFQFQFLKLRLIASYFVKNLGASLVKYFEGPLAQANFNLSDIINKLAQDMPKYVDKVTQKIGPFIYNLIIHMTSLVKKAGELYKYFKDNPEKLKDALAVILLIYGWFNRTQVIAFALFSALVEHLRKVQDGSAETSTTWEGIWNLLSSVVDLAKTLWDWIVKIVDKLDNWGFIDELADILEDLRAIISGDFWSKKKTSAGDIFGAAAGTFDTIGKTIAAAIDPNKSVKDTWDDMSTDAAKKASRQGQGYIKNGVAYLSSGQLDVNAQINKERAKTDAEFAKLLKSLSDADANVLVPKVETSVEIGNQKEVARNQQVMAQNIEKFNKALGNFSNTMMFTPSFAAASLFGNRSSFDSHNSTINNTDYSNRTMNVNVYGSSGRGLDKTTEEQLNNVFNNKTY